jgi:hypothetical protein
VAGKQLRQIIQMGSRILNLPFSLGADVLSSWLDLKSVARLDQACCNRNLRSKYLDWAAHSTCSEEIRLNRPKETEWIVSRSVSIAKAAFEIKTTEDRLALVDVGNLPTFIERYGRTIKHLKITYESGRLRRSDPFPDVALDFIAKLNHCCPAAVVIELKGYAMSDAAILAITEGRTKLVRVSVTGCSRITTAAFKHVWTHCKILEVLEVQQCGTAGDLFGNVAAGCPLLRELCYLGSCAQVSLSHPLPLLRRLKLSCADSGLVESLASVCPALQTLIILEGKTVTKDAWALLFDTCTALHHLELAHCAHVDFTHLRSLRTLCIDDCSTLFDADLVSLVRANPLLESVEVINCWRLTIQSVRKILQDCPHVRHLWIANHDNNRVGTDELLLEYVQRQHPHILTLNVQLSY